MSQVGKLLCYALLAVSILLSQGRMARGSAFAPPLEASDVEAFLEEVVLREMQDSNIPNLTLAVVYDGEILLTKGYGYADVERRKPVDPHQTLFRIGSTAKAFTWTAVMQLAEQGKVDLDTDVNAYLDFEVSTEPITIRHLMAHTPGFEDYMMQVFSISEERVLPLAEHVRVHQPARVFPPGSVSAYSNYGTVLAGYIVERVSGVPYAQYIEENIYRPLGMDNSTFRQPLPEGLANQMAKAYRYVDGEFLEGRFEFMSEPSGSMSSSSLDMAKFMLAYLQGGRYGDGRILAEETVQRMFAEQTTHHPRLGGMAHGFIKGTFNGRDTFYHPGGTMLFDTGLYLMPDEGVGFFISHSGGNGAVNIRIFQAFLDRYFPYEAMAVPEPAPGSRERAAAFAGEYYQNRRSFTTIDAFLSLLFGRIHVSTDQEGHLLVILEGETNRFVEAEPGVFVNVQGGSETFGGVFRTVVFGTDPFGKTMLMTDGPMSYSRAYWYETTGLTFLMLISSILFILGSVLYWGLKALIRRMRKRNIKGSIAPAGAVWAKRTVSVLGLLTFVFVGGFLSGGEVDPVYQLPAEAFMPPSALSTLIDAVVPHGMVLLALAVLVFTVLAWVKGYWKAAGRIHYTLIAVFSGVLSWLFYFWNVI